MKTKKTQFKPWVGRLASLRRDKRIIINPLFENDIIYNYIDNRNGDKTVLVLNESTSRVHILFEGKKYDMSKFYLHTALDDEKTKLTILTEKIQDLTAEYISLLANGDTNAVTPVFVEFGNKLKLLQDFATNKENKS